jgi:hypothetical protein
VKPGQRPDVDYEVRDQEGNLLEIVLKDGMRIYVAPPEPPPEEPRQEDTERE